ncbi:MAG: S-methyl-5-thioribose-1-phosphate isomerase [Vicingaceae bacterium]
MKINGTHYQSIWIQNDKVQVFDQRFFPHKTLLFDIENFEDACYAIKEMVVRGAPLIGVTAAYGMYLCLFEMNATDDFKQKIKVFAQRIKATRPTAVNLAWAVDTLLAAISKAASLSEAKAIALNKAEQLKNEDVSICEQIGNHGLEIIKAISEAKKGKTVNMLTHCNAGWLATIDWGTATAPIYKAQENGIDVHVWVDETRPRNQGANLTAFELGQQGVKHTLIPDNTGGHLMQHGMVDVVIVGTDRVTRKGDVANKIGTYLKALAAKANNIPFYVALPSSTLDTEVVDGVKEIPIETRNENEVKYIRGKYINEVVDVLICPENTPAINYGFDVTPADLVTGFITERGICEASEEGLKKLFPERF